MRLVLVIAASLLVAAHAALAGAAGALPTITTVAGSGQTGRLGDDGPAAAAEIGHPRDLAVLADGSVLITQPFDNVVRLVRADGTITTVAGTGEAGYSGDGGPAVLAKLNFVHAVAAWPGGEYVLADTGNNVIRRVTADGTISTIAGVGSAGFSGDGGLATAARLWAPHGLGVASDGSVLVADTNNDRIRRIAPDGTISTVAGTGTRGFSGDGGPATAAQLSQPFDVAPLSAGGFLVIDGNRVRRVNAAGTIATVVGTGTAGYGGDGGPATAARLHAPHGLALLGDGGFLIADAGNHRVRRVWPDGTITTAAGSGVEGFIGDGGPANAASLDMPKAVTRRGSGFLVADAVNNRVRFVDALATPLALRIPAVVRSKRGSLARLPLALTDAATVRLDVLQDSQTVLRRSTARPQGKSVVTFGRRLAPGRYSLRLAASAKDGRHAEAAARLVVRT